MMRIPYRAVVPRATLPHARFSRPSAIPSLTKALIVSRRPSSHASFIETGHIDVKNDEGLVFVNSMGFASQIL